jgi:hypothetical protein
VGVDGIEGAQRVYEGRAGVHGHSDAKSFGDFLLGGTGLEGSVGVEGNAAIAARGDSYGHRDELAGFFTEERGFGVGRGEDLIALQGVGREFGELGGGFGEFGLIVVPIEEHGCASWEDGCGEGVYRERSSEPREEVVEFKSGKFRRVKKRRQKPRRKKPKSRFRMGEEFSMEATFLCL